MTRRFRAAPGTTDVAVRYRFQSDEHRVAQITGSYANDWYEVIIRTTGAGGQAWDRQTVASRWSQFDGNHATPWYTLRLPVSVAGDTVEVTLTVANAVDNAYLWLLYADIVQETVHEVTAFALNALHHPTDPYRDVRPITPLDYVSASAHAAHLTSYGGLHALPWHRHGTRAGHRQPAGRVARDCRGGDVSSTTVGRLLHELGYRLQSVRKSREGTSHPDRNAQFEYINATATAFLQRQQPVISVDTTKKELVGDFKNAGQEWQPTGSLALTRSPAAVSV